MGFFEYLKATLKALALFVFWMVGGLIIFLSGISMAAGFNTYFLDIPILAQASGIVGLIVAFIGVLMMGYGYRYTRSVHIRRERYRV